MRGAREIVVLDRLKGKLSTTVWTDSTIYSVINSHQVTHGGARIAAYTKHTQASSHQPTHGYNVAISALPPQEVSPFLSYSGS